MSSKTINQRIKRAYNSQTIAMITLIIRAIILYLLILFVFRIMGKRQIGQMQPFELVLTLIIADLATIPMGESAIPILHGVIPLLTLLVVHFFMTIICQKSNTINKIVNGKPVIVINHSGIDYDALKSMNISLDDLLEGLRGSGYFSFDEIEYAIVETTGKINVLPKSVDSPATKADIGLTPSKAVLPITLISEGTVMKENLNIAKVSQNKLNQILKDAKIKNSKNVLACTIDENGKIFIQEKYKPAKVINSNVEAKAV